MAVRPMRCPPGGGTPLNVAMLCPTDTGPEGKFSPHGQIQRFPGNTVLCRLVQPAPVLRAVQPVLDTLRPLAGRRMAWLPASSYHVTLFDGLLDMRRQRPDWPDGLALEAPMAECHQHLLERLRAFAIDPGLDRPLQLVPDPAVVSPTLGAIPLRPVDARQERQLRRLRDRLAGILGVRRANHDTYQFHMTLGYCVQAFDPEALQAYGQAWAAGIHGLRAGLGTLALGPPEFCRFEDMAAFETLAVLGAP